MCVVGFFCLAVFFPSVYYVFCSVFSLYNDRFLGWYFHSIFKSHGEFCYLGFECYTGASTDERQISMTWEIACMLRKKKNLTLVNTEYAKVAKSRSFLERKTL